MNADDGTPIAADQPGWKTGNFKHQCRNQSDHPRKAPWRCAR
jgi:hypothetical protein